MKNALFLTIAFFALSSCEKFNSEQVNKVYVLENGNDWFEKTQKEFNKWNDVDPFFSIQKIDSLKIQCVNSYINLSFGFSKTFEISKGFYFELIPLKIGRHEIIFDSKKNKNLNCEELGKVYSLYSTYSEDGYVEKYLPDKSKSSYVEILNITSKYIEGVFELNYKLDFPKENSSLSKIKEFRKGYFKIYFEDKF